MLNVLFSHLYQHLYSMCYITFRLHVQELTVMSGGGDDREIKIVGLVSQQL